MYILEIAGTSLGLLYLYWEYKANPLLWLASIAMPAIYLKVYLDTGLYADFVISVYYILASVYGMVCWMRAHKVQENTSSDSVIRMVSFRLWLQLTGVTLAVWLGIVLLLLHFTDSAVPWADAFTTALSIVAMWMLAHKYAQQWLVWIVADLGCSCLYLYKGLYFTSILYLIYALVAVAGYRKWMKIYAQDHF